MKNLLLALSITGFLAPHLALAEKSAYTSIVDKTGNIILPDGFRTNMTHLGSWFVPQGEASGFHDVYMNTSATQSYQKDEKFPDGTVIIKELRAHKTADYTTGANVSYASSNIKQWFVMIKDTKGRFSENKSWGDGWGWALIKTDDANKNVSTDYKKDCLGCHVPAKNNDWIYIEGYPSLSK